MRILGALLLAGGSAALGFRAASRLAVRCRAQRAMLGALEQLERELGFRLASMPELLAAAAGRAAPPAQDFLRQCLAGLDELGEKSMAQIWDEALPAAGDLGETAFTVLRSLGAVLGRFDGEAQRESLASARGELALCLEQAEEERRRMGRVYGALGVTAGAFLSILLL